MQANPQGLKRYQDEFVGKKFGRLEVIGFFGMRKNYIYDWVCVCECGNVRFVSSSHLRTGLTKSCGCTRRLRDPKTGQPLLKDVVYARRLFREHCKSVRKLNVENLLTQEQYISVIKQRCYFCHREPFVRKSPRLNAFAHLAIDRLDRRKDFSIDNVISVCRWCKAKNK